MTNDKEDTLVFKDHPILDHIYEQAVWNGYSIIRDKSPYKTLNGFIEIMKLEDVQKSDAEAKQFKTLAQAKRYIKLNAT